MKNKAFTLAEVLIVIVVIGLIAVMTILPLIKKSKDREIVVRVKKIYSVLCSAYESAVSENGEVKNWDISVPNAGTGAIKVKNYFKPFLKVVKDCENTNPGCFPNYHYKGVHNGWSWIYGNSVSKQFSTVVLNDGTLIAFWSGGDGGYFIVDINGTAKPNKNGEDTFWFTFDNKGVYPNSGTMSQTDANFDSCNRKSTG